jgi:TrmH family RNA methyltransferase
MVSKAKVRLIKQLQVKKYRQAEQCFIVQGGKAVKETLASGFTVRTLLGTQDFLNGLNPNLSTRAGETFVVNESELTSIGSVESNNAALAVVAMSPGRAPKTPLTEFILVLDDIRDPGNLGTIIRTADWYGIRHIVASEESTDFYNPKVISATMGSFLRVNVSYTALPGFLAKVSSPVYGALLNGENVHTLKFAQTGALVIGNESNGISAAVEKLVTHRVTVPRFGEAESLNASTATAVILDNIKRAS